MGLDGSKWGEVADLPGWAGGAEMAGAYVAVALPGEVRANVEERLASGGELGRSLAERLRHGRWRMWTIVPAGSGVEPGRSLDEGGVASAKEARSRLSAGIGEFLQSQKGRIALFENDVARAGDEWLRECGSKLTYSRERVLHYAQSGDAAITVDRAIRDAQSPHRLIGALIESVAKNLQRDLSDEDLSELALMAVAVICDVFDGESYIVAGPVDSPSIALL